MSRSHSRAVVCAAFAAVAVPILVAPPAGAEMLGVEVAAGSEGIVTGCRYTVTATLDDASTPPGTVFFWLSGGVIPGNGERLSGEPVHHPGNNTVTTSWTPTRIGSQNITAIQSVPGQCTSTKYVTVEVTGTGLDTGSSCVRTG
ncbi:hypothetical protein DFR70_106215 [Nocardia tenerifensis]|uniref:Ig-like domain-containing protein n=1 Tax=Nocardia tenerifensis TaxID=228006 RepID=A0A318JZD9_9NOCA|nr:hypothetical protein [Nocardia tenerifensis]PXX63157.1 hypothetical protein DFR70_106215 [Nocardia tenerifensis]